MNLRINARNLRILLASLTAGVMALALYGTIDVLFSGPVIRVIATAIAFILSSVFGAYVAGLVVQEE